MMYSFIVVLISLLYCTNAFDYTSDALADQILSLPGLTDEINFNQFSGYLAIPGASGNSKHMHYWLVESMNDPTNDPLTFWTNGGPGCSGLIGFMTEQGPFRPNADGSVSLNEYAWNKVSNTVFIESPAGVGFSYSDSKSDYTTGDSQTALDNYNLIQAFLVRFPHFANTPLYITSESYGGHYMPTLAKQIVDSNTAGGNPILNFKGFAVGNPYTDVYSGTPAMLDTYWGHQLVSKPTYDTYLAACTESDDVDVRACARALVAVVAAVGDLNPYALDYPVCTSSSYEKKGRAQRLWFFNSLHGLKSEAEKQEIGLASTDSYEPCEDNYSDTYLNRNDVKTAIHVETSITWEECSNTVIYNTTDSASVSTAPLYNYLIDGGFGLNILVYSGDDDSVCATIGTQEWIWDLGYSYPDTFWEPYIVDSQTAGYLTKYQNGKVEDSQKAKFAFLTIHGAGHEVPTYKPEIALDMFTRYLNGEFTNE